MDLVTVDRHSLRWKYSVLAAAAVFLAADISNITRITGKCVFQCVDLFYHEYCDNYCIAQPLT